MTDLCEGVGQHADGGCEAIEYGVRGFERQLECGNVQLTFKNSLRVWS
jgi:hypothetical protein